MASKEEIERRVQDEAEKARRREEDSTQADVGMVRAVRPLVERVIELEEEAGELRERLDQHAPKLVSAETRAHNAGCDAMEAQAERARLTDKLKSAEQHVIEQGRTIEVLNSDRSRILADLTEARAGWRTAEREHDETTAALRAQVAALSAVIDGHEQAILDACADVRASCQGAIADARAAHQRAVRRCTALETTVDVLAGRLAASGA